MIDETKKGITFSDLLWPWVPGGILVILGFWFFSWVLEGPKPMTRKETIAAIKECTDAGLKPRVYYSGLNNRVVAVDCDN